MTEVKIGEQIAFLRHQREMTQEQLAERLGVTNQAVSKWESAQCCPDIGLLPDISKIFNVSVDELLGYKQTESFENLYLKIKDYFKGVAENEVVRQVFRLAILLHEVHCTLGYKDRHIHWDTDKNHGLSEDVRGWGYSAHNGTGGSSVYTGNGIFFADSLAYKSPGAGKVRDIQMLLRQLADKNVLRALYTLSDLTIGDFDVYPTASEIAKVAGLSVEEAERALENLCVQTKDLDSGDIGYRIDGSVAHLPSLLLMLMEK